jgi:hypothetical protein
MAAETQPKSGPMPLTQGLLGGHIGRCPDMLRPFADVFLPQGQTEVGDIRIVIPRRASHVFLRDDSPCPCYDGFPQLATCRTEARIKLSCSPLSPGTDRNGGEGTGATNRATTASGKVGAGIVRRGDLFH